MNLAAPVGAEEPSELFLRRPYSPLRLALKRAEGLQFVLGLDDPLHDRDAQRSDQLVFEVGDAHVKTETFQVRAHEVGAEAGSLETTPEVVLLSDVT